MKKRFLISGRLLPDIEMKQSSGQEPRINRFPAGQRYLCLIDVLSSGELIILETCCKIM